MPWVELLVLTGMLCGGLTLAIARMLRVDLAPRPNERKPPPDDPRWNAPPTVQIVGKSCAHCTKRFVREIEATACDACARFVHASRCAEEHARHAHLAADVPYR